MRPVRTEPEVPAVRPVAPPAVVFALGGVLPSHPRALAPPRANSLERTRLLESESDQGLKGTRSGDYEGRITAIVHVLMYVCAHRTCSLCPLYQHLHRFPPEGRTERTPPAGKPNR